MTTYPELTEQLLAYKKTLPSFSDGRINYQAAREAPIVLVIVMHEGCMLLLKRSDKVLTYQEKWNCIGGYIDEVKEPEAFVVQELQEELKVTQEHITDICPGEPLEYDDTVISIRWFVYPFRVELQRRPTIELDWEHTEHRWIDPQELLTFDIVPNLDKVYDHVRSA